MADPFTGEIRIFCGNYVPDQWAACNGALLQIQQNSVLFAIIGNRYGGNGTSTFQLPNLNGMAPLHQGNGNGLTPRNVGDTGGAAAVTLTSATMPNHSHAPMALNASGNINHPDGAVWAQNVIAGRTPLPQPLYAPAPPTDTVMYPMALAASGGGTAHNNLQPYLPLQFIICLYGEFPSRPS